ncbi:hypothetical protein [Shinella pollutisoli]|uniref:Beta-barrel assembly machine subunit BamF n=1 Tax=Shinella pollutisoli TaxID=2250594 RepID=A0ABV7DHD3_9HYPH|nr:hypothetical protein [Shinella pollutisoli]
MGMTRNYRMHGGLLGLVGASFLLAGCMGPTYGTSKTAGEQLMEDLGDVVSIAPDTSEARKIKYQPRGALVVPKNATETALVTPQKSVAGKDNPEWIESPEEMRERLREEATANQDDPNYRSPLVSQHETGRKLSAAEQQAAYREARKVQMGAYADKRRYLSDPPLEYRRLPEGAEADLGESERDKERRRRKAAAMANSGRSWWPF